MKEFRSILYNIQEINALREGFPVVIIDMQQEDKRKRKLTVLVLSIDRHSEGL